MKIDINSDVGEGVKNEHLLIPYISSCNIACGGHFGDVYSMDKTIKLALENDVKIGAHPSFPDKENFGRKLMQISDNHFKKSIQSQLDLFSDRLSKVDAKLNSIDTDILTKQNIIDNSNKLNSSFIDISSSNLQ